MALELWTQFVQSLLSVWYPFKAWEADLTVTLNGIPGPILQIAHYVSESMYVLLALVVFLAWRNHSYRRAIYFVFAIFVNLILGTFFKLWVNEPRPPIPTAFAENSPGFPSRHTLLAWTAFGLASDPAVKRSFPQWIVAIWAAAISISRLVLGVHYLHDVIGGIVIGYMATWLLMKTKKQVKFKLFDLKHYPFRIKLNKKYQTEILRQTFHMGSGITLALLALVFPEELHVPFYGLLLLASLSLSATVSLRVRKKTQFIPYLIILTYLLVGATGLFLYTYWNNPLKVIAPILVLAGYSMLWRVDVLITKLERKQDLKKLPLKGMLMFLGGCLLASLFYGHTATVAAIMIVALGDGVSTFFGILFGTNWIFYNQAKAWEGIAAGIIVAFFGVLPILGWEHARIAVIAATLPMLLESADPKVGKYRIDDNLSIPVLAGAIVSILLP